MQSMVLSRESISSVYAIVIPVRPLFATSSSVQLAGIRSDTIIGTSLRRACGASCIRLYIFELFKRVSRARTFIVTVIDVAKRVTYRFLTYIIHLQKYNPNRNRHEIRGAVLHVTR